MRFTKRQQGAISVFLALILLLTFTFSAIVVDGGRIYASKNIVSGAGQLALNSGLSNYDKALKDAYGLIAMSETPEELQDNLHTYFVDSLGACGITEDDYNTALVFLQMAASEDSFTAAGVTDTEICQGYVMEQQVLDYMKYRAPITLGTGILDKLKSTKEITQAKVVADDEVQTAKALNDVQKELEKLKKLVDEEVETSEAFQKSWESDLKTIRKLCKDAATGELLVFDYNNWNDKKEEGDLEETINQFNTLSARLVSAMGKTDTSERNIDAYDILKEMKAYYLSLKDVTEDQFMEFWCEKYELNEDEEDTDEDEDSDESTEEDSSDDELKEAGKELFKEYTGNRDYFLNVPGQIQKQLNNDLASVEQNSINLDKSAKACLQKEKDILEQFEKIRNKLDEMKEKLDKWKEDTKSLENQELKKQVEENQKVYEDLCKENAGMALMEKDVQNNKDFYEKFIDYWDEVEFCNVKIKSVNSQKSSVLAEIDSHEGKIESGNDLRNFILPENFFYLLPLEKADAQFIHEPLKDLSETDFYDYLEECCGKKKKKDEIKEANQNVQKQLETVLTQLQTLFTTNDLDSVATNLQSIQSELPSAKMGTGNVGTKKMINSENTDIDKSSKREKSMNDALDTLNKDNSTLDKIGKLASETTENIIEPLYITEYIMNMYSYYTIDKTGNKKSDGTWETKSEEKILSLSDYKLYEDLIYRAEAEYILWGNKENVAENVNTTKAVIFAIQFVGNLMYALTQPVVTKGAKQIGALFVNQMLAVIVQVVVEVVVATVETVRDMVILINGGSVVPFKILSDSGKAVNNKEWKTKLQTIADISTWDMTKDKTSGELTAFSYKDYLWIMICIKSLQDDGRYEMLARAADLCQVNLAKSENNSQYRLMDKYTMLKIDADVELDAWLVTDLFNTEELGLETSGKFTLHYKGIQGY